MEKIKAGEYANFSDLPPAKGKGRPSANDWDARVLLLQVQQTKNPRCLSRIFRPGPTQCFGVFSAVKASFQPSITPELMAYLTEMGKYAKRFQRPSWIIYDQNVRQEMALRPGLMWSRAEPTIFSQCFLGMAKNSAEAWCKYYHSVDHASDYMRKPHGKLLMSSSPPLVLLQSVATTIRRKAASFTSASTYIDVSTAKVPT